MTVNQARRLHVAAALITIAFLSGCNPQDVEESSPSSAMSSQGGLRFMAERDAQRSQVAARVGGTVITVDDVRREAAALGLSETPQALRPSDQAFRDTLSDLIDQRLLALEAVARDIQDEEEARLRLAAAEERILGNILVENAIASAVSDEAVQQVYEEQSRLAPRTEEIRARHILVETREEADEVARLLAEGGDFGQLAAQVSRDLATRFSGGDLGYFTRSGILTGFAQVAFDTGEGEVSAPFETEYGWHVLQVMDRRLQPRESLDDVRPNIIRFLTLQGIDDLLEVLRERYPVTRVAGQAPSALRTTEPAVVTPEAIDTPEEAPGEDAP
ncbi:Peptidylprolyl isomerase [Oceanicaulis sp. 350]|nr:Peptidylprolyl isomerase [Oceanicaulis sp. 350]